MNGVVILSHARSSWKSSAMQMSVVVLEAARRRLMQLMHKGGRTSRPDRIGGASSARRRIAPRTLKDRVTKNIDRFRRRSGAGALAPEGD
jgi:hypothetical protein